MPTLSPKIKEALSFSIVPSPLDWLLIVASTRGICRIALGSTRSELYAHLHQAHPNISLNENSPTLSPWIQAISDYLSAQSHTIEVPMDIQASPFYQSVWQALYRIPYGQTRSYTDIALSIHAPKAVRAVAQACANNPLALIIPCHRIIRKNGELAGYRWGIKRKHTLLQLEQHNAIACH